MTYRHLIGVLILIVLAACSTVSEQHTETLDTAALGDISWNQRVKFTKTINRVRVYDVNNVLVSDTPYNPPISYIDLPAAPSLPPLGVGATIEKPAFLTPLTTTEKNKYIRRGRVNIRFSDNTAVNLNPYGEVITGELVVLASVQKMPGCAGFNDFINTNVELPWIILESFGINLNTATQICYARFNIGDADTTQALTTMENLLTPFPHYVTGVVGTTGFVVDRNVTRSVDPPARAFDPSCEQITKWLDPTGDNAFDLISMTKLLDDMNITPLDQNNQDVNVSVTIIGSGLGANDLFQCGTFFFDHDNHIASIIQTIAPNAALRSERVCTARGVCSAGNIIKALMRTVNYARQNPTLEMLVNMSLGGPLADKPTYEMLEMLGGFGIPLISSGGNGPFAPTHFPATYSADVSSSALALDNVLSVAALGFKQNADGNGNSGYKIAGFNTRRNGGFFAPGVNSCPPTAIAFRCNVGAAFPNDLGLTGSSFAAPVVTGLAALYTEKIGHIPLDLSACLQSNVNVDPITNEEFVALNNLSVAACQ
jgi:hypothetical protein